MADPARASCKPDHGYSFRLHSLFPRNITSMDAYAFALALGTAGLAAMTVLGFHHGYAPGDLAGLGEIVRAARRDGAAPRTKLPPARGRRRVTERLVGVFEQV